MAIPALAMSDDRGPGARKTPPLYLVTVFAASPGGGNPAPIAIDAAALSALDMQGIARAYGHESGFVLPPPAGSGCDLALRFWVPNHEMDMCGHATVGAVWLLDHLGLLPRDEVRIWTQSGVIQAHVRLSSGERQVEISQPEGTVEPIPDADSSAAEILSVLGIGADSLAALPIENARTSRVKTLVPLRCVAALDRLRPDYRRIEAICQKIGSTGLYPYAASDLDNQVFDARQFPKSSGYPEDAATGIAATALAFGLLRHGLVAATDRKITVRQGRAMGRPSEITVRFQPDGHAVPRGCWLGGKARLDAPGQTGS